MSEIKRFREWLLETYRDRTVVSEIKSSWIGIIISTIAGVVGALSVGGTREQIPFYIFWGAVGSFVPIVLFVALIKYLAKGTTKSEYLKARIQKSFIKALEESYLNPNPERKRPLV
jgi:hypothetical protein